MTISDDTIKKAAQRYHREYDRYLKLGARVAEICRVEIVEGNAIRAQVTFRAKSPKSLEGKLRRFAASGKKVMPDADAVFDQIRDLAAVRIATYEQRHERQVVDLVCKRFADARGGRPVHEEKDKHKDDPHNFYRAFHVEAFLSPSDVVGTYSNVADVPCEIQVCSMMAHVWNEIEHDLGYKPLTGALSDQERKLLISLGHAVRQGDITIRRPVRRDRAPAAGAGRRLHGRLRLRRPGPHVVPRHGLRPARGRALRGAPAHPPRHARGHPPRPRRPPTAHGARTTRTE